MNGICLSKKVRAMASIVWLATWLITFTVQPRAAFGEAAITPATSSRISALYGSCEGDCDDDGSVTFDEVTRLALTLSAQRQDNDCLVFTVYGDINDLVQAVNRLHVGCEMHRYRYQLRSGSMIRYFAPRSTVPEVEEPITGSFELQDAYALNLNRFGVVSFTLHSAHFTVSVATPAPTDSIDMSPFGYSFKLRATINGQEIRLVGAEESSLRVAPPTFFDAFHLCGGPPYSGRPECAKLSNSETGGYDLTINADSNTP